MPAVRAVSKKAVKPVKWRKWATLEKEPEAATREDLEAAGRAHNVFPVRFHSKPDDTDSKGKMTKFHGVIDIRHTPWYRNRRAG